MNIPHTFRDTFGLVVDPLYSELVKVANHFESGQIYRMQKIFDVLEGIYRKPNMSRETWHYKVNKTVDALITYNLFEYQEGEYIRTKYRV